ncbi:MAG TPA: DUF4139 domain-containing protein [Candidatus Krumholzibacteria bacterium]|nr:DUF4139 domain-containing protein [Candidatus Krumholzibacteria bacterium]HRX50029.1 DUF4139 domain-containing protein [Candidatus Krumholzibacteria bacterium]
MRTRIPRTGAATGLLALSLTFAAAAAAAPQGDAMTASEAADRSLLELTVYNRDLALVRETRTLELPKGPSSVEFRDVPAQVRPRTLIVEPEARAPFRIVEQSYEFDLMSREKILEKYVGRTLSWIQEDGTRVEGTLLGMAQGPVYQVGGEVVFEVPGRLALPSLPADLRARPTLVWRVDAPKAGDRKVDVSYLTGGLGWSADYVLQLDDSGERGAMQSWISVENRSGAAYRDARLMLLAGDVNVVRDQVMPVMAKGMRAEMAMADYAVAEESVGDYHLYTVPGTTVLKDNEIKQISLFQAEGVPVQKAYRLEQGRQKVDVLHIFRNDEKSGLGLPLPAGTVRVYGRSGSGARQLLGEARIDHTPKDEKLELLTGQAFDLAVERTMVADRKRGERSREMTWRIEVRNGSERAVTVDVREAAGGEWTILKSTHEHTAMDASRFRFDVAVPARGKAVLEYTVLSSW